MDTLETLTKARALAAKGWTQNCWARDADGYQTRPIESAACFCTLGAIEAASPDKLSRDAAAAALVCALGLPPMVGWIIQWNDEEERTQAEVLAAFDKAIEAAKK